MYPLIPGRLSGRLYPVNGRRRIAGRRAPQTRRGGSERNLDVLERRRMTAKVEERHLVETSTLETRRRLARRRHGAAENVDRPVVELLQPDQFAVAPQRIRTESQVEQRVEEQRFQSSIDAGQLVAVQPEIPKRRVQRRQNLGAYVDDGAVVQVETGRLESVERAGVEADVTVAVEEQVLQAGAGERGRMDGAYPVVAEIEPAQGDEVGEGAAVDVLDAALAHVEVPERGEPGEVPPAHGRRLEDVSVDVQLERFRRDADGYRGETATGAVHDATEHVAETRRGTVERWYHLRRPAATRDEQEDRSQTGDNGDE